jgi:SAM-dependent methyltransferase
MVLPSLLILPLAFVAVAALAQLDVPYVPTPQEVVNAMIAIAKVGPADTLYDLGCGDGRIVIAAAKAGAHATGLDLDADLIEECNQNAKDAGVTDRVKFMQEDIFETDFSDATVLALYLLPSVNLRLRPRILGNLKPGTRIVTHDFNMGDWEPDRRMKLDIQTATHTVYFWVVPANATGLWEWTMPGAPKVPCSLLVTQHFQTAEGTLVLGNVKIPVDGISITGDQLQFSVSYETKKGGVISRYSGTLLGDTLTCTVTSGDAPPAAFTAKRDPATKKPLDVEPANTW